MNLSALNYHAVSEPSDGVTPASTRVEIPIPVPIDRLRCLVLPYDRDSGASPRVLLNATMYTSEDGVTWLPLVTTSTGLSNNRWGKLLAIEPVAALPAGNRMLACVSWSQYETGRVVLQQQLLSEPSDGVTQASARIVFEPLPPNGSQFFGPALIAFNDTTRALVATTAGVFDGVNTWQLQAIGASESAFTRPVTFANRRLYVQPTAVLAAGVRLRLFLAWWC